jgi:hypothetical protein
VLPRNVGDTLPSPFLTFLHLGDETTALSRKVRNHLPSNATSYVRTTESSTDTSVCILYNGIWKGSCEFAKPAEGNVLTL